jgi:hypothetical protein
MVGGKSGQEEKMNRDSNTKKGTGAVFGNGTKHGSGEGFGYESSGNGHNQVGFERANSV